MEASLSLHQPQLELVQLRKRGPLVEPFSRGFETEHSPPRALKSLARIIDGDLCHRCGSCIGICPTGVLSVDDRDFPAVQNLSACTDCDLCVKVCPGDEFDAPKFSQELFGAVADPHDIYGFFESSFLAYSADPIIRSRGTSGGLVSALLIHLLEKNYINGAVVVTTDENKKWKGVARIARTREEILAAAKSKYAITPVNTLFDQILEHPGRYALVGLPCQIHGFLKASELNKTLKERIVLTIGLLCHAAVDHEAVEITWEGLSSEDKENTARFLYRHGKHAGSSYLVMKDGSEKPLLFPKRKGYQPSAIELMNILYRLYTPPRCFTCYDAMAEYADLCVGDPWMVPPSESVNFREGYSYSICRSKKAEVLLRDAETAGALKLLPLDREHAKTSNLAMGREKRGRAFRLLNSRSREGLPVPHYGFEVPPPAGKERVLTEVNLLTHTFSFLEKGRASILRFLCSDRAYHLWWLNHKQRRARFWLKQYLFRRKQRLQVEERGGI